MGTASQLIATIAASFLIAFKERSTRTSAPILQSRASFWREIYGNRGMQGEVIWDRHAAVLDWINDLALAPGSRVLEIGCGAGFMAIALAQRGFRVHAIGSAEGLIMGARRHA